MQIHCPKPMSSQVKWGTYLGKEATILAFSTFQNKQTNDKWKIGYCFF